MTLYVIKATAVKEQVHPFFTQLQKGEILFYTMILKEKGGFES